MKAYVCNKCNKVITQKDLMKNMTSVELKTDFIGTYETMHLCDDCKKQFNEWIRSEMYEIPMGKNDGKPKD